MRFASFKASTFSSLQEMRLCWWDSLQGERRMHIECRVPMVRRYQTIANHVYWSNNVSDLEFFMLIQSSLARHCTCSNWIRPWYQELQKQRDDLSRKKKQATNQNRMYVIHLTLSLTTISLFTAGIITDLYHINEMCLTTIMLPACWERTRNALAEVTRANQWVSPVRCKDG